MKIKTLKNGNIKDWYDREEEFTIINKNKPLYDTLIDANISVKQFSQQLVKEIKDAGLDEIHGLFISIDDYYEARFAKLPKAELDQILNSFNSLFKTNFKYHINDNVLVSILFGKFDVYEDFKRNYFGTFFLKMFAFRMNMNLSEEKNDTLKGLSGFISKYADDYLNIYLETSIIMKFEGLISVK